MSRHVRGANLQPMAERPTVHAEPAQDPTYGWTVWLEPSTVRLGRYATEAEAVEVCIAVATAVGLPSYVHAELG